MDPEELLAFVGAAVPFSRLLGIEMVAAGDHEVRARLAWRPELCTAGGILHGGALMALADTVGAVLAFANLPPEAGGTATASSSTNFFRPVAAGHVEAVARLLHTGRTTLVVETDLTDSAGRRVARVTQIQAVLAGHQSTPRS